MHNYPTAYINMLDIVQKKFYVNELYYRYE